MLRLSANLTLMFSEFSFLDRFEAAAEAGFKAVEIMYPYDHPASEIAARLRSAGLSLSVINLPPGDYAGGERGLACIPGKQEAYRQSLELGLEYALSLGCERVHLLTGNLPVGATLQDVRPLLTANIRKALQVFVPHGIGVLLEPLSKEVFPRYSLTTVSEAVSLIDEIDAPQLRVQLDLYHTQMEEGNLCALIDRYYSYINYVQIAGVPGRHEPDICEINYPYIFGVLENKGFDGWVGCEYVPKAATRAGLGWAKRFGISE